jgi:hypothetical protein
VFPVRRRSDRRSARRSPIARVCADHLSELAEEPAIEARDPAPSEDGPQVLARWTAALVRA